MLFGPTSHLHLSTQWGNFLSGITDNCKKVYTEPKICSFNKIFTSKVKAWLNFLWLCLDTGSTWVRFGKYLGLVLIPQKSAVTCSTTHMCVCFYIWRCFTKLSAFIAQSNHTHRLHHVPSMSLRKETNNKKNKTSIKKILLRESLHFRFHVTKRKTGSTIWPLGTWLDWTQFGGTVVSPVA